VELLERQQAQLITGLQQLYRCVEGTPHWPGAPLIKSNSGKPLTHDILERLNASNQNSYTISDISEENPSLIQQHLTTSDLSSVHRQSLSGYSSENGHFPVSEARPPESPPPDDHDVINHVVPSPPNHTSRFRGLKFQIQIEPQISTPLTPMQHDQTWAEPTYEFDHDMDFFCTQDQ
jgi:hypothetical protein